VQLFVDGTPSVSDNRLLASISGGSVPLVATVDFFDSGAVRVKLSEKDMPPRWQVRVCCS
jgi:hypothetical protein